ncbi:MAG: penicillin-binding protein 2 [bacterium]
MPPSDNHAILASMARRQMVIGLLIFMGLVGIAWRLFTLQIIEQKSYVAAAQNNRIEQIPKPAPRGEILDRHGKVLATTLPRYDVTYYISTPRDSTLTWVPELAQLLQVPEEQQAKWQKLITEGQPYTRVSLIEDVPLSQLIPVAERQADWPGVTISVSTKRSYPYAQATSHLTGYLGAITPAELERLGPLDYRATDLTGKGGLEQQYGTGLRGKEGWQSLEVDHRGRVQAVLTEPLVIDPQTGETREVFQRPQEGPPLHTTLDIDLQMGIADLFGSYRGAVVAMDVNTGEILAAYSNPAYDPNVFAADTVGQDIPKLFDDPSKPVFNRFLMGAYPPGSTFKVVVAMAGLEEHAVSPSTILNCDGVFHTPTHDFHCNSLSGHGAVTIERGIAVSCNEYFYQLGDKLGVDRISKYAEALGLGQRTGIDLPLERQGLVPTRDWKLQQYGEKWYQGDTLNYAIGQSKINVTPLQQAALYAFIANGGHPVVPHLNADAAPATPTITLQVRPETLATIRAGLRDVVTIGTARSINVNPVPGLMLAGKTGTADDVPGEKPHSWFISYAPYDHPQVVLVVIAEQAGHGSDAALPVAKQIYRLKAMQRYLGMLPAEQLGPVVPQAKPTQLASLD